VGTVYRKTVTKRLPPAAELFKRNGEQFARWKDAKGRTRTAPVTVPDQGEHAGRTRLVIEARTYTAKYRDGSGIVREVATGCHDEDAANAVLGELIRRSELVRSGFITAAENAAADHQQVPLAEYGRESKRKDPKERQGRRTWKLGPLTYATIGAAVGRCGRLKRQCGTATRSSRPTSTPTRSCWTWPAPSKRCRCCRWPRRASPKR
jgi:hypothetical protein